MKNIQIKIKTTLVFLLTIIVNVEITLGTLKAKLMCSTSQQVAIICVT